MKVRWIFAVMIATSFIANAAGAQVATGTILGNVRDSRRRRPRRDRHRHQRRHAGLARNDDR